MKICLIKDVGHVENRGANRKASIVAIESPKVLATRCNTQILDTWFSLGERDYSILLAPSGFQAWKILGSLFELL